MAKNKSVAQTENKIEIAPALFRAEVEFDGKVTSSEGNSAVEALTAMKWPVVKGKTFLRLKSGKLKAEMPVYPQLIRKLSLIKVTREIIGTKLLRLMK